MSKYSVEERLSRAHFQIMRHPSWCAFAGVVMMGTSKVMDVNDPSMPYPTACVDVRGNRKFGRQFMEKLNDKEFMYLVLHESLHFALSQLTVYRSLFLNDPQLCGVAADHVVNNLIEETEETSGSSTRIAEMPKNPDGTPNGCCDKKYRGWNTKQVYDDLCQQYGTKEERQSGKGRGKPGQQMDGHDASGKGEPGEDGEGDGEEITESEIKEIQKAVDQALRQGAYLAGKLGGKNSRTLEGLMEPKIDWKAELADFITMTCVGGEDVTWKKPFKRFVGMDIYFPSFEDEMVGELVFAMDVSGSCWSYGERFLSEGIALAKTVKPKRLRVIQWDCGVVKEQVFEYDQLDQIALNFELAGGGGTTVAPVADYVKSLDDIQAAIILTDGDICGPWDGADGWGCPTLWALTSGRHLAPTGKTLRLELSDW